REIDKRRRRIIAADADDSQLRNARRRRYERNRKVQLLAWADRDRNTGGRHHGEPAGSHQPLDAVDDQVRRTNVEDLESQECWACANVKEEQVVLEVDCDGRT